MQHLAGRPLPRAVLPATMGIAVDPAALAGLAVIFCYPWTGRPGHPNPPGWDEIPGAHGSTPQALAYSKVYESFRTLGVKLFGVSLQDIEWQQEFAARHRLAYPLLSDARRQFSSPLGLPLFETGGRDYLVRLTLIARDGLIIGWRYPVASPERDAGEVLALLASM
jgi:peroxiredoxin